MSTLKPVGVFWDIENCCVPKGKSALKIIERIRERYFQDCREAEFICVCDINKESENTIRDLNDGQINVVHINATAKNAADDKIRQSLRRFSDSHPPGTKVILISSDVNFASDLSDLRHRKKFDVVLIHKSQVSEALLSCATEHHLYEDLITDLPDRPGYKEAKENVLVIYGYSKEGPLDRVRQILKMLSNNCGGKVLSIGPLFAILKFETPELLERAKKRMNGADVYGRKITVCLPDETPFYNTVRKLTATQLSRRQESPSPQRRPGRERLGSRSYTPESYDTSGYGGSYGFNEYSPQSFSNNFLGAYNAGSGGMAGYGYCPATGSFDSKAYKTPGGPVHNQLGHVNSPATGGQGNSPSHTHTLPNSNSEKYYSTKSGPSSLENSPYALGTGNTPMAGTNSSGANRAGIFLMGDLSNAARSTGETITVFKPAEKRSLADIPIPSFGFRDIPPPTMPAAGAGVSNSSLDPNATAFDPIKLIETASKDSMAFMTSSSSQSNLLGPNLPPDHPESQPSPQPIMQQGGNKAFGGRYSSPNNRPTNPPNKLGGSNFTSSKTSAFTKHQPQSSNSGFQNQLQPTSQHQSRSLSVPAQHTSGGAKDNLTIEDEICIMHGYPPSSVYTPASAFRSQSHNSGAFKKPASPQRQYKNSTNANTQNRHNSPGNRPNTYRSNSREMRQSFSSDGEDRPYSPLSGSSNNKQGFRPRLASVPGSGITSASPTNRTPSPLTAQQPIRPRPKQHGSNLYRVPTPDEIGDPSTDYVNPDFNAVKDSFVELVVSNLDYNIHPREWRKIIYATFHPHVKILSIQVRLQADNTSVATVRLPSEQDARFAIAQFHRRKIGYKRINVMFKSDCSQSPGDSLRTDTVALLMEAKDNKLALSRLIDLFDKRFHKTVSVSDIYKMRDTIQIQETGGAGRWVKLQPGIRRTPTPTQSVEGEVPEVLEQPVCTIHCKEGDVHYTEALNSCMLPNVQMLRKHFSPQLHSLLLSHNGYIPLMSFPACYSAEFKPIEPVRDGGIPLEHVISCVPGVEITVSKAGVKVIQFQENREQFYDMMKGNSWQQLGKISREVMELLRQQQTCTMPVSKFIPAYHHYFGRQCRVADYGYTKLQELFEAIPHAVQVLGTGDRKAITLSPRAQLKRFTTDILKVVKAQPAKQIMMNDFPPAYETVMGKPLFLPHYGVCFMEDVLMDIPTTTLIVIEEGNHVLLALPRRDQTPDEVERTKQFALEVVDLLKHKPQCRMPFNKFIPAYHHHFGRQCRVADYGFNKLTDLFEAIAHVVELEEEGEERLIHLSMAELRKVLCEQLTNLIRPLGAIPVSKILTEYAKHYGFCLKLDDFGAESTKALLLKLRNHIKIEVRNGQEFASLVKEFHIPQLGLQIMQLLMDESGGSLPLMELCMKYESLFGTTCDINQIKEELFDYVQIDEGEYDTGGVIRLTSQQMLGRNLRLLLLHHEHISISDLSGLYQQQYGVEISPALYGFPSLFQLLLSFPHILEVKGKPTQKYIILSGMLGMPGTLPPTRVDVTSPIQNSSSGSSMMQESGSGASAFSSELSSYSSPPQITTQTSELLRHASQLWDPSMAMQISSTGESSSGSSSGLSAGTRILDLLNGNMNSLSLHNDKQSPNKSNESLSPNGVPVAWQMRAGGQQMVSGNLGNMLQQLSTGISPTSSPNTGKSKQIKILTRSPVCKIDEKCASSYKENIPSEVDERGDRNTNGQSAREIKEAGSGEDVSLGSSPLDTSSVNSQHNSVSSSPSSISSPIRRRNRIVAKFKVAP